MTKSEDALANFTKGFDCCKAVVAAFKDDLDLDDKHKLKCLTQCSSLPGRPRELCGAVIGAIGVISNLKESADNQKYKSELIDKFKKEFSGKNESLKCSELLGCDLSDPYAMMDVMDQNLCDQVCRKYVSDAVEILDRLIKE